MNPSCIYNRQSKAVRALWNFLTSPTGAFLIAVSAILIGYYQFYISRPILKYTTETTEISSASGSDDFKIHINGKDYPKLYKTAVTLSNTGEDALAGSDVSSLGHDPIRIPIPPRVKILYYGINNAETSSDVSAKLIKTDNAIVIEFNYLNPDNQITVNMYSEDNYDKFEILGSAADIKRLDYLGIDVTVLDEAKLHDLGMDMLLSVAQGSVNSPRVAVLQWKGKKDAKEFDLGLVGKGVTFDSGGISLKPAANMGDMKGDMTGSAVVVAAIKAAALQKLPVNVVGVVGLVENMPSGSATRPGDVVRSMSGQTVEIVNTDAEGRLVLGDCLWYIQEKFGVKKIIDVATLTGSTMMTFGFEYAGLFANDDKLAAELTACGETSGEKLWRLPINAEYDKLMDSDIADMKNTGPRLAGGITAACFLQRFIKEGVKWAHLDIAGVDKDDKGHPLTPKGATGFGVRVLNCLLRKTK